MATELHGGRFCFWTLFWTLCLPGPLWTLLDLMGTQRAAMAFFSGSPCCQLGIHSN